MENPFLIIDTRLRLLEEKLDLLLNSSLVEREGPTKDIGNIKVAVEVTCLTSSTIYHLVSKREIPHMKQGGRLYFSRKALREWINEGERKVKTK